MHSEKGKNRKEIASFSLFSAATAEKKESCLFYFVSVLPHSVWWKEIRLGTLRFMQYSYQDRCNIYWYLLRDYIDFFTL